MEKYISFTVPSDSAISTVGQVLRAQGHLTKKQISRAKFLPDGIQKMASAAGSQNLSFPVTKSRSVWKLRKLLLNSLFRAIFLPLRFCMRIRIFLR